MEQGFPEAERRVGPRYKVMVNLTSLWDWLKKLFSTSPNKWGWR